MANPILPNDSDSPESNQTLIHTTSQTARTSRVILHLLTDQLADQDVVLLAITAAKFSPRPRDERRKLFRTGGLRNHI